MEDPWYYQWIGFDGALSARFAELGPVFHFSQDFLSPFLDAEQDSMLEYRLAAKLFELYAMLFAGQKHGNHYVRRVKDYINALYMHPVRVEEIAERMNLDRRYLSRLFKEKTGQSIQEYLISIRMEAAKLQLSSGVTVATAARLCGYDDVCNFSKMFKRRFGISPTDWGKKIR